MWLSCVKPERWRWLTATASKERPRKISCRNEVRLPRGPHSTNRRTPPAYMVSARRINSTGDAQCDTAKRRIASASVGKSCPVVHEYNGKRGGRTVRRSYIRPPRLPLYSCTTGQLF